ncbi:MAG: phosphoesterase [Phototrophicales bacterium]|nr:MAG: phosphoesterase [Phototrophicales bacterium]RMG77340.1 MAG: phosphoesterase [Chloroflexota bacterium]
MRVAWLTDIHFEFLNKAQIDQFLDEVAQHQPDALLITGDIANAKTVASTVQYIALKLIKPVYFVLGNHDFYGGDIEPVRAQMATLTRQKRGVAWMPAAGVVELTPHVALVGHDGWGDGQYGDFMASTIMLNDYVHIQSLRLADKAILMQKLNQLGVQAGDYLRGILPEAARQYPQVMVMLHPPPFQQACWYQGKASTWDDPFLPHFTCKAAGDALLDVADAYPHVTFTVLCGHVHSSGEVQMRPNLRVLTGGAEYEQPEVQRIFDL